MGMLTKIIIILGLVLLIASQFTSSKQRRKQNRATIIWALVAICAIVAGMSVVSMFKG